MPVENVAVDKEVQDQSSQLLVESMVVGEEVEATHSCFSCCPTDDIQRVVLRSTSRNMESRQGTRSHRVGNLYAH